MNLLFEKKCIIRRKRHFDENVDEEELAQSALKSFKVKYFLFIVDQALSSLTSRFQQFQEYEQVFGFLFDLNKLKLLDVECLKCYCLNIESYLKYDLQSDIDGKELASELKFLK